jgi:GxxExxY protein
MKINQITYDIRGAAFTVHRTLGPGLLEGAYEACLTHELQKKGYRVDAQVALPLIYDGLRIDRGFRLDLLVADAVIVELKAVDELAPVHTSQLLTYMRLAKKQVGLLMNFNVRNMQNGIKRYILESALNPRP